MEDEDKTKLLKDKTELLKDKTEQIKPSHSVLALVKQGEATESMKRFTETFTIGRHKDNDLQVGDSCVSKKHVQISFDGSRWWIKDMDSANGTYLFGIRIQEAPLPEEAELELGKGGPVVQLVLQKEETPKGVEDQTKGGTRGFSSATQIIRNYFDKSQQEQAGEQTMMFRHAVEGIHKKKSKKYMIIIGISLVLLLTAGGVIIYQKHKISKMRNAAIDIFYNMKSIELQIAQLESIALLKADPEQVREILAKREQLKQMENNYDNFVNELGIYKRMGEDERTIFRVARLYGECDVNIPAGFVREVMDYIGKWKATNRLKDGINRAKMNNYVPTIVHALTENNLPPQFFYLALQESGFERYAVGPKTRYGHAKGMWQFIPSTAKNYGLRIGPLQGMGVYDPQDERFDFERATVAAARYLKYINNTEAQASGLLVMASYNWGESNVRDIIRRMPENPGERNFWRLLAMRNIPRETYDYVFYIFSASVICENPRLFGFDFDCPQEIKEACYDDRARK
jgi:pSer/pThr/pTyr-binding forkhead associated (FHA) protein